jgi:membrane-associated phospholipid phosphatase
MTGKIREILGRPYPVTLPMVILVALVPLYVFIPGMVGGRAQHVPALPLDDRVPLVPAWALVYGPVYLFLILLPIFLIRRPEHIRRTVYAYLTAWIVAYVWFVAYPTVAPRPATVPGDGFAAWGLRFLYDADPPANCFPSLHVAHASVSALTCARVHRGVGAVALLFAVLVAASTLFTRQHYVADVAGGMALAGLAWAGFLRGYLRGPVPDEERRLAPAAAGLVAALVGVAFLVYWAAYRLGFTP